MIPAISCDEVKVSYGKLQVLRGVTFDYPCRAGRRASRGERLRKVDTDAKPERAGNSAIGPHSRPRRQSCGCVPERAAPDPARHGLTCFSSSTWYPNSVPFRTSFWARWGAIAGPVVLPWDNGRQSEERAQRHGLPRTRGHGRTRAASPVPAFGAASNSGVAIRANADAGPQGRDRRRTHRKPRSQGRARGARLLWRIVREEGLSIAVHAAPAGPRTGIRGPHHRPEGRDRSKSTPPSPIPMPCKLNALYTGMTRVDAEAEEHAARIVATAPPHTPAFSRALGLDMGAWSWARRGLLSTRASSPR